MKFVLNGKAVDYSGDPNLPLYSFLREAAGLTSVKKGCAGEGVCGYCTVQLNEKTTLSCHTPMKEVDGAKVTTIEGWEPHVQDAFADAFLEKGGLQCGFCTPGIVMLAKAFLDKNPNPTREQVVTNLNKSLCRCTGYHKIVDSILLAAESIRTRKKIPVGDKTGRVGERHRKYDARDLVLGFRPFVGDMVKDGMRFGALKFSDHPRARVLSINTSKAAALPGVTRVFTAKDIPGDRIVGIVKKDWPLMIREGEETRYIGDVLAGVVAESEATARKAVELIEVFYDILEPVTDVFAALEPESPKVHKGGNILCDSRVKRGNVEQSFKNAAFIAKGRYTTQRIEHAFAEPEACLAEPWDQGVKVFSQGQGAYEDRKQIAQLLNLPEKNVAVIQVETGGGFGGKEDLSVQGHAALYAYLLKKPVRIVLERSESIRMHPKRHPFVMDYALACDKQGKFIGLEADLWADTGAYASVGAKVVERAVGHAAGAYVVPNVEIRGLAVYTNNIPSGAMRGFGVNQATFAMESCVDDLCAQGGFDRWQIRYDNAVKEGDMITTGQIIRGGAGVRATLEALKDEFKKAKHAGIACGIKNTGIGNGMHDIGRCKIEIVSGEKVILHHGWTEMGQGIHTMGLQTLCQETGIDPKIVEVKVDTRAEAVCGMTTASRGTSLLGSAVINACKELKADLKRHSLAQLKGKTYAGEWVCNWTTEPGHANEKGEHHTHYSYGYATQVVVLNEKGKIETVYAAHDAGKIMNPTLFEGQIQGSIHMGLGYALTEELPMKDGRLVFDKLSKCGVIRARHMPNVVIKGVEVADPHGPYGAKGVGEIGLVPTAAAVAGALRSFDGKRRFSLPMKDADALP